MNDAHLALVVRPYLEKISDLMEAAPQAAWNRLPADVRDSLEGLKSKIDNALGRQGDDAGGTGIRAPLREVNISNFDEYKQIATQKPQPNTLYKFDGLTFRTDHLGRPVEVAGTVDITKTGRRTSVDTDIGNIPGSLEGDVGFHLGADSLGFPGSYLNVVPGNGAPLPNEFPGVSNLNQGAYGTLESELRALAGVPGNEVEASFKAIYKPDNTTSRPDEFQVISSVNVGRDIVKRFTNQPGG